MKYQQFILGLVKNTREFSITPLRDFERPPLTSFQPNLTYNGRKS